MAREVGFCALWKRAPVVRIAQQARRSAHKLSLWIFNNSRRYPDIVLNSEQDCTILRHCRIRLLRWPRYLLGRCSGIVASISTSRSHDVGWTCATFMPLSLKSHSGPIKVLVADADVMACRLLASGLRRYRHLHVYECHLPAAGILKHVSEVRPDILLVAADLADGPLSGFAVAREVFRNYPESRIVVLLESSQRELVVKAFRSGARGVFCRSDFEFKALWKCVFSVTQGQIWANSQQLEFVMEGLRDVAPLHVVNFEGMGLLTKREEEVVRQVVEGLSNREIAGQLNLSEHTVKNYLFHIFEKLGISSRVELVTYAIANNGHRLSVPGNTHAALGEMPAANCSHKASA